MSAIAEQPHEEHVEEASYEERTRRNRLGLWLFLFSEIFLFGALLAARFYLWGNTRPDLDQGTGLLATSILLLSSGFMALGEAGIGYDDRKTFLRSLLVTAVLGTLFLVVVVGLEWNIFGIEGFGELKLTDGIYGAIFYVMTGFHALHVLSGVILILLVWNNGRKGHFSEDRHWGVEGAAVYWHYVDVVWIFLYPALYLIGNPVSI
ncbi:MAG: heme-copper oxidase subunit III [Anaerolineae bacterium]|nr:MAG: heme-copper oxidase subunit III [Anaerolineae bacterium]